MTEYRSDQHTERHPTPLPIACAVTSTQSEVFVRNDQAVPIVERPKPIYARYDPTGRWSASVGSCPLSGCSAHGLVWVAVLDSRHERISSGEIRPLLTASVTVRTSTHPSRSERNAASHPAGTSHGPGVVPASSGRTARTALACAGKDCCARIRKSRSTIVRLTRIPAADDKEHRGDDDDERGGQE